MKTRTRLAALVAVAAFGAVPALALAEGAPSGPPSGVTTGPPSTTPPSNQGTAHRPSTPGPKASLPAKARAYGYYCQKEPGSPDRMRSSGQQGTAFSQCVTAMAKLATGKSKSPRTACRNESKKPLFGQRRTPFSLCVSGGTQLLRSGIFGHKVA